LPRAVATRATIAEKAYRVIKAQIISGALPAGQRLMANLLAGDLDISPTPVKEALLRLQRDGLVEVESRRWVMVRRFRSTEIEHLYEVRNLIEQHALITAFARGQVDATLMVALEQEQRALLAALDRRTEAGLIDALAHDRMLHARLVTLTGNPLMIDWHAQVMTQTHTVRVYSPANYTPELIHAEHGAILAALGTGDQAGAQAALRRHLARSQTDLIERTVQLGEPAPC
jgi:DNA-binding GntR family transcriptional regulator